VRSCPVGPSARNVSAVIHCLWLRAGAHGNETQRRLAVGQTVQDREAIWPRSESSGGGFVLLKNARWDAPAVAGRDTPVFRPRPDVAAALPT